MRRVPQSIRADQNRLVYLQEESIVIETLWLQPNEVPIQVVGALLSRELTNKLWLSVR